jgi:hypothetical protein
VVMMLHERGPTHAVDVVLRRLALGVLAFDDRSRR